MSAKTKAPAGPDLIPAEHVPAWASGWSLGLPVNVSHAGDTLEHATAAGCQIPAPIVDAVRTAAHVSAWQNSAHALGNEAESRWRAQAIEAARNLEPMPSLDDLVTAKSARDVDGLAAGLLLDLTREAVAAAYRAVRDNAADLVEHGMRPVYTSTLAALESLGGRLSPLVVDEVTAIKSGSETATAWLEATEHAERYWSLVRARAALQHTVGLDPRDRDMHALVGRRVDQRTLKAEPRHPVAVALHRARNRAALELWMPTPAECAALLDAKAAA